MARDPTAPRVRAGLSMMPGDDYRRAVLPLLAGAEVDALEWTYELGFDRPLPDALEGLLVAYADADALTFHGVSASPCGPPPADLERTLGRVRALAGRARPRRISEHFGFVRAEGYLRTAPMPVPRTQATIERARERLARLSDAAGAPVGLESLAFAFSRRDVDDEPGFLEAILAPLDGFVLLDLHNLFCRAQNFGLDPIALLERQPLARVRELHLSGGSESPVDAALGGGRLRRDTHDGLVPDAVFALLDAALARCPQVDTVILERLPDTLATEDTREGLRADFRRMRGAIAEARR